MSSQLQRKGFLIWMKGPAALETMKTGLCGHIESVWTKYLQTLTGDEIEHLEQFIEDMNGDCAKADFKKKKWTLMCGHSLCESILKKLIEIRHNKKSLHIAWKTCCNTTQITYGNDLIGLANIYERHRMICKTYYWSIANMFMFYGGEINDIPSTCPGDTDFALVLKMMKNCTLFELDEIEIYDTVIYIRNRLFHTGQYNTTEKAMESMIGKIIQLLKQVHQLPDCEQKHRDEITNAIQNLDDLKNRDTFLISLDQDWNSMAVRALELKQEAIECDIRHQSTLQFDTDALEDILEETNYRLKEYKESDIWNREEIERLEYKIKRYREEIDRLNKEKYTEVERYREDIKRLNSEKCTKMIKMSEEIRRLILEKYKDMERNRQEIERLENEIKANREIIKRLEIRIKAEENLAGLWSENAAEGLREFAGPIGGAVGAVGGGVAGTAAEGVKKLFSWF